MPKPLLELFALDDLLTDDERAIRDSVRGFARDVYTVDLDRRYEQEHFPTEHISRIGELGVLGAQLEGYGCPGLGKVGYGVVMREALNSEADHYWSRLAENPQHALPDVFNLRLQVMDPVSEACTTRSTMSALPCGP